MKICVAQIKPTKGNIQANIEQHKKLIALAIANQVRLIIFPELSLTSYEPELAEALAMPEDDARLNDFQIISDQHKITIGVGVPLKTKKGITISLLLFQPHQKRQVYSKKYLHEDERPFFISGDNGLDLQLDDTNIALAICYEISVEAHTVKAFGSGASVYIASVAKTATGVDEAHSILTDNAKKYQTPILFSNSIGEADGMVCAGRSAVWNKAGTLVEMLDEHSEGIVIWDTVGECSVVKRL